MKTELWRHIPRDMRDQVFNSFPIKSISQGMATPLVAALDPDLAANSSAYLDDCQVQDVIPWTRDEAKGKELWAFPRD